MKTSKRLTIFTIVLVSLLAAIAIGSFVAQAGTTVVGTIDLYESAPSYTIDNRSIAINQIRHRGYVLDFNNDLATVIKTDTDSRLTAVDLVDIANPESPDVPWDWHAPVSIAVNLNTDRTYVANWMSGYLIVIGADEQVEEWIKLDGSSFHRPTRSVVVNPSTDKVYVTSHSLDLVYVIEGDIASPDYNTVIATIGPLGLTAGIHNTGTTAINPNLNRLYVTSINSIDMAVVDVDPASLNYHTVINNSLPVGTKPWSVAVNPDTAKVYVANYISNDVTVIDGAGGVDNEGAFEATIDLDALPLTGVDPRAIDVNVTTNKIYVANEGSDNVSIIDGSTNIVVSEVSVGDSPRAVAVINRATGYAYVANYLGNSVSIIDSNNVVVATETDIPRPYSIAIDMLFANPKIYVVNRWNGYVTVLDPPVIDESPLTTTVDDMTGDILPTFSGSAVNSRTPFNSNIIGVYYQLDGMEGEWKKASITNGTGTTSVDWQTTLATPLELGSDHTLYTVALDVTSGSICSSDAYVGNSVFTGSIASYDFTVGVSDTTPPAIINNTLLQTYLKNAPLTLDFYATDEESGVASVEATLNGASVSSGQTVTLDQAGPNVMTITATDNAGNTATESYSFDVTYDIEWRPPIKFMNDIDAYTYEMQDGSTLPIKWIMRDHYGNTVEDLSVEIEVSDRSFSDNYVTFVHGLASDNIRFDSDTGQYIVNMRTGLYTWMDVGGVYDVRIIRNGAYLELLSPCDFTIVEKGKAKGK